MRPIKNYTSDIPINRIFEQIQKTLVEHGAKQMTFDYGDAGEISSVQFIIRVGERLLPIKLPARVEKAQAVLQNQYESGLIRKLGKAVYQREHAYRVAWRNILDWLEAQMALLDIEMVKLEEVFLPYVTDANGKTLFEVYEERHFRFPELPATGE